MGLKHGHATVLERNKFYTRTGEEVNLKTADVVKRDCDYINHCSEYKLYVTGLLKADSHVLLSTGHSPDQ